MRRILPLVLVFVVCSGSLVYAQEQEPLFPLGKSWVGGQELPLALGIGGTFYWQEQDYELVDFSIDPLPIPPAALVGVEITNSTKEGNLQVDLWLLPFLNVFGIVGAVNATTVVANIPVIGNLEVDYDGVSYGGGFTLAGGTQRFFTSLTTHFMLANLNEQGSSVRAWLVTPKAGIHGERGAIWGGALYQNVEEEHQGSIMVPYFGELMYDVVLRQKSPWNYLVGGQVNLATHWDATAEVGFGNRKHAEASLTYRR
jgi:hypothetical protein